MAKTPKKSKKKPTKAISPRDEKGRFIAGASGNPQGRPRDGESMRDLLESIGAEKQFATFNGKKRKLTKKEILARLLWEGVFIVEKTDSGKKTLVVNERMAARIMDRMDGPVGSPVNINIQEPFIIAADDDLDE